MTTAPASSSSAGTLIGVDAGAFWLQDFTVNGGPLSVDFKFKTDWGITVPLGYDFGNGFSLFASIGYYSSGIDGLVGNVGGRSQTAQVNGAMEFVPILANASYKLPLGGGFNWYLGAGVGTVYSKGTFSAYDNPGAQSISYGQLGGATAFFGGLSDTSWNFEFTAFTGLSYDISPNASLNLGYRFQHINDSVSVNGESSSDFNGHSLEIGFSLKL